MSNININFSPLYKVDHFMEDKCRKLQEDLCYAEKENDRARELRCIEMLTLAMEIHNEFLCGLNNVLGQYVDACIKL